MIDLLFAVLLLAGPAQPPPVQVSVERPQPPVRDAQSGVQAKGTGVIRGKITSADGGRPLRRAQVRVTAAALTEARTVSTNTSGRYEIKELPPGRYTISVTRSGYLPLAYGQRRAGEAGKPLDLAEGQTMEHIDFAMPRMGVISGRVVDEVGEPVGGAQVYAMELRYYLGRRRLVPAGGSPSVRTDDAGQYRLLGLPPGEYAVMASLRETWPMDDDPTQVLGYMQTYFPSTGSAAEAQLVRLGVGQEVGAIDVALMPGRTARISGVAMSSSGAPIAGQPVMLSQEVSGPTMMMMMSAGSTKTAGDGSWTLTNVPPGEYRIQVRTTGQEQEESADTMITVAGGDIEGVTLVAGTGGTLRGVVVTEDGSPLAGALERLVVRGRTVNLDSRSRMPAGGADNGRVGKDGVFEFKGAIGATLLTVTPMPPAWSIKAIEHDGRDVADTPLEVRHGETIAGLRVVLTNTPNVVRGTIRDERTQATADGTVVVFTADSARWGEASRAVRAARPDQHGRFEVKGLPPGDYLVAALEYVRDGQWNDPEFLHDLKSRAERFSIGEMETKQVDLVVIK